MKNKYNIITTILIICVFISGLCAFYMPSGKTLAEALPRLIVFLLMFVFVDIILFILKTTAEQYNSSRKIIFDTAFSVLTVILITCVVLIIIKMLNLG